jgi:hypothetical protein
VDKQFDAANAVEVSRPALLVKGSAGAVLGTLGGKSSDAFAISDQGKLLGWRKRAGEVNTSSKNFQNILPIRAMSPVVSRLYCSERPPDTCVLARHSNISHTAGRFRRSRQTKLPYRKETTIMQGNASRSRRALRALITGSLTAFCGLALTQSVSAQSFPTQYAVQNIGPSLTYNGAKPSYVFGGTLGNSGKVLAKAFFSPNIVNILWDDGILFVIGPESQGLSYGLNNYDECTGSITDNNGQSWAMIGQPQSGSYKNLGLDTSLFIDSVGDAINDYHDVVGTGKDFSQSYTFVYAPRIFHTPYLGPPALTFNTLGSGSATPSAVNNNGLMVGSYPTNTPTLSGKMLPHAAAGVYGSQLHSILKNGTYAFYWTYFAHLTDLTPSSGLASWAMAVNNNNQILVTEEDSGGDYVQAYIYNYNPSTETVTSQIPLTAPYANATGAAINDSSISVGSSAYPPSGYGTAVIYDTNGKGYDLNNYIASSSLVPGARLTKAISINNSGQILALDGNSDVSLNLYLLTPIVPQSLTISNPTVAGGKSVTGTVTLNYNANVKTVVHLSSSNTAAATVPTTVTVAAGSNTAHFTITTKGVSAATTSIIQANYNGVTLSTAVTVNPAALSGLSLSPSPVAGSLNVTGKVSLNGKAPAGGIIVTLTNTNPAATVPISVPIAAGATASANFTITTVAVASATTGMVTASYNGVSKSHTLTVRPIGVKTVQLVPNPVVGGNSVTGTVTLEAPAAPGKIVVTLSSNNTALAHPTVSSITIQAGSQTGIFTVQTAATLVSKSATISASANGVAHNALLQVNP